MAIRFVAGISALVLMAGCASQGDLTLTRNQLKSMEERLTAVDGHVSQIEQTRQQQRALDNTKFCYAENLAYSEGSIKDAKICKRVSAVTFDNDRNVPLSWQPWIYATK